MKKQCKKCSIEFNISNKDKEFYTKISAPEPSMCPDCRMQKRMAYRNERVLYPSTCGMCKKSMLSMYKEEDGFLVYCLDCWWKDDWDATTYGKDIDWDRSLLEQWDELRKEVPRLAVAVINSENCEYTNMTGDNKDCYLLFAAENNENCSYGKLVQDCKDCFDCNFVYNSELCYYCLNVRNCYRSIYLKDCQDSRECSFSVGLRGCSNVFLSSNLHNKEYYIENQLVPKEEYAKRVAELTKDYDAFQECIKKWKALDEGRVVKYANNIKSPESTGDYLQDCKRVNQCYDVTGGQDCSYVTDALEPRDTYDASFIYYKPELVYDSMSMLQCYNVQYSVFAFYCSDVQYGDQVHNSDNLLLSSCVRNKKNLILNKQYSKAEYKELREKVIEKMKADGEYGELPGMEHSLFRYNDTVANEYFPLAKADAIEKGLQWNDEAAERTTKDFKLTAAEKIFYKEMNLPEPKLHPEARHQERMGWRNPRKLWHRQCMCEQLDHGYKDRCSNEFETTYATERIEKVYCDSCYKKEFY